MKRRERKLSKDEQELWALVTRQAKPFARPPRVELGRLESRPAAPLPEPVIPSQTPRIRHASVRQPVERDDARPASPAGRAPVLPVTDVKLTRRLSRGVLPIDACLDLHGFRQDEAYSELKTFLTACQRNGLRNLLIITGKGARDGEDITGLAFGTPERRGVLRRLVPQWLAGPDFTHLVAAAGESGRRHGGGGALYVTVKRLRAKM